MLEEKITLTNEVGLHARPAARFVTTARKFKSVIKILKEGLEGDAKSITSILLLDAKKGDEMTIRAEGEDSAEAIEALVKLVRQF